MPKAQIFVAREIITTDPNRPRAEAVAVVGVRIAAMRSHSELEALAAPQRAGDCQRTVEFLLSFQAQALCRQIYGH